MKATQALERFKEDFRKRRRTLRLDVPDWVAKATRHLASARGMTQERFLRVLIREHLLTYGSSLVPAAEYWEPEEETPIVRMANAIMVQAILARAPEVHLIPSPKGWSMQYLVGDVLEEAMTIPSHIIPPLRGRFKEMAGMPSKPVAGNIVQKGRIPISHDGSYYDILVTFSPMNGSEKLILVILPSEGKLEESKWGMFDQSPDNTD